MTDPIKEFWTAAEIAKASAAPLSEVIERLALIGAPVVTVNGRALYGREDARRVILGIVRAQSAMKKRRACKT